MINYLPEKLSNLNRILDSAVILHHARMVNLSRITVNFLILSYFPNNAMDVMPFYSCMECKFYSCFNCRQPAHKNLACDQYKQNSTKREHSRGEEEASYNYLALYTKTCFLCGRQRERIDGCDHITCPLDKSGCNAEWCWRCGADYTDIRAKGIRRMQRPASIRHNLCLIVNWRSGD
jgi:hypothetical protein